MLSRFDKFPLASSGWAYLLGALGLALCATALQVWLLAVPLWLAAGFIAFFFRDPKRFSDQDPNTVISPADGRVVAVEPVEAPELPGGRGRVVSIFMDLFDVHVNRAPFDGKILDISHMPGGFGRADSEVARVCNERLVMLLQTSGGQSLAVAQVAGLVARNIECWASPGDSLRRGERYGMIRFGSRLDVYFPEQAPIRVKPGQRVKAGITPIGEL